MAKKHTMAKKPTKKYRDRMLAVADLIESRPKRSLTWIDNNEDKTLRVFNMAKWTRDTFIRDKMCRTACCIAGYTAEYAGVFDKVADDSRYGPGFGRVYGIETFATEYFGLDDLTAKHLFLLYDATPETLNKVTVKEAVDCLRHLANTGEVVWPDKY